MPYLPTAMALIGGAFILALVAIISIVHVSYQHVSGLPEEPGIALPEDYRELLSSERVSRMLKRTHFDLFFRRRLLHRREAALRKWRLSRKERNLLMDMSDAELAELYRSFVHQ